MPIYGCVHTTLRHVFYCTVTLAIYVRPSLQWRSEGEGGGGAGGDICPRAQGFRGAKIDNLHMQIIIALTRTGPRVPLESTFALDLHATIYIYF